LPAQDREIDEAVSKFSKTLHIWIARNPPGFAYVVRAAAV